MTCRGEVVGTAAEKEAIVYGEVDMEYVDKVRTNIPISSQRQTQVYTPAHPNN